MATQYCDSLLSRQLNLYSNTCLNANLKPFKSVVVLKVKFITHRIKYICESNFSLLMLWLNKRIKLVRIINMFIMQRTSRINRRLTDCSALRIMWVTGPVEKNHRKKWLYNADIIISAMVPYTRSEEALITHCQHKHQQYNEYHPTACRRVP